MFQITTAASAAADALYQVAVSASGGFAGMFGGYTPEASGPIGSYSDNPFQGLGEFAKGAAFGRGGVRAFAKGDVFTRPTLFQFRDGAGFQAGVMGEAGDEAVMPLKRGRDGKLGVAASGGGGGAGAININVTNEAGDVSQATATAKKRDDGGADIEIMVRKLVRDEVGRDMSSGAGPISSGLKARGVNLSGNLPRRG